MGQLDASVATLAFPALRRQFSAGLACVQRVSLAYLLTLVALLVPVGRWSDQHGRKLRQTAVRNFKCSCRTRA
jgi:MFS family permease